MTGNSNNKIIVTSGLVSETRHHHAAGVDITKHDPPRRQFFLIVEHNCDGVAVRDHAATFDTYSEAMVEALEYASEDGAPIEYVTDSDGGQQ